jgi:uncharacterized membrane protein YbhN (UPF0104 family)
MPMSDSYWWRALQLVVFMCVLTILAAIIAHYSSELDGLRFHFGYLIPLLFVSLLCILFRAFLIGEVAAYFGIKLRLGEMLALTIVSTTLSETLPMRAGTLIKPSYLWWVHQLSVSKSITMVVTSANMITAGSSLLAIAGLIWVGWGLSSLTGLFAALAAASLLPFFVYPNSLARRLQPRFEQFFSAWYRIHSNPRRSRRVLATSVVLCTFDAVRFWLAFLLIGTSFSFAGALVVSGASLFMGYFGVVPGALGLIEASVAGVSLLLGYSALNAVVATLVFRASILFFTVPATPVFYFGLMKAIRRRANKR